WLLADDARPAHFLHAAHRIGDAPVAPPQLHRLRAAILYAHVIGPDITVVGRGRLVLEVIGLHGDANRTSGFGVQGCDPPSPPATGYSRRTGRAVKSCGRRRR